MGGSRNILMYCIAAVLEISISKALIMFWHSGYNDRRDRLVNLIELTAILSEEKQKEFDCLITRLNAGYKMRNTVAHSVWGEGEKPNSIKPHTIIARGGKIKLSGFNLAEELFTPERFEQESQKIQRIGQDLIQFAADNLGYVPDLDLRELEQAG